MNCVQIFALPVSKFVYSQLKQSKLLCNLLTKRKFTTKQQTPPQKNPLTYPQAVGSIRHIIPRSDPAYERHVKVSQTVVPIWVACGAALFVGITYLLFWTDKRKKIDDTWWQIPSMLGIHIPSEKELQKSQDDREDFITKLEAAEEQKELAKRGKK